MCALHGGTLNELSVPCFSVGTDHICIIKGRLRLLKACCPDTAYRNKGRSPMEKIVSDVIKIIKKEGKNKIGMKEGPLGLPSKHHDCHYCPFPKSVIKDLLMI